jgi:hypothetical protein
MSYEVVSVSGDGFTGSAHRDGSTLTMVLGGTADHAAIDPIEMLLSRVHGEAKRTAVTEVVVDVRQLEFMNSSCFKGFISWLTGIDEMPQLEQYKVRFVSNPSFHWQKRSLASLRNFAIDLVTITVG